MKKKEKKVETIPLLSIEKLLQYDNSYVINYVDEIANIEKRIKQIIELKNYLNDCLLDRDAGYSGTKLVDLLDERLQRIETNIKEYKLEDLIWWKGTEGQLIYLYEELVKKNLIDSSQDDRKYVLLSKHFKNKKGEQFTNKQMSQAAQNLVANKNRKPTNADKIETIIEQTTKHN